MKCQELLALWPMTDYAAGWEKEAYQKLANHIRTCALCGQGIVHLSEAVIAEDILSCDGCRVYFPVYYEVTRPIYTSSTQENVNVVEVAIHLGKCIACAEEYCVLVELWNMEEQL